MHLPGGHALGAELLTTEYGEVGADLRDLGHGGEDGLEARRGRPDLRAFMLPLGAPAPGLRPPAGIGTSFVWGVC